MNKEIGVTKIAQILNKFFSFRKEVILSDLELYNSSFVTQTYQSQESDDRDFSRKSFRRILSGTGYF